jgi:hypothetical protein
MRKIIPVLASVVAGCVVQLPPVATPEARAPALVPSTTPPPEGHGRLVLDVVNGPTPVELVRMAPQQLASGGRITFGFREAPEPLCTAPCTVDPPLGNLLLGYPVIGNPDSLETELVHVGPEPTVYRRALSEYHHVPAGAAFVLGVLATSLGGTSMVTGTALLPVGLAKGSEGLTIAGGVTLGAGAALIVLGILGIRHDSDWYRPGAAIHF